MNTDQHTTSTPNCNVPVVLTSKVMVKRPADGFDGKVNDYRPAYRALQPVVAKPLNCIRVVLTGAQPELEKLFVERYDRQVRMHQAKLLRKIA